MKFFLTALAVIGLSVLVHAQIKTTVYNQPNEIAYATHDELGEISLVVSESELIIGFDFDGAGESFQKQIIIYKLSGCGKKIWNEEESVFDMCYNLSVASSQPSRVVISPTAKSIHLFYSDSSSLLYQGKGIKMTL